MFVAVSGMIAVLHLQAQGRGDKNDRGDKGKSGQGFHNERHDGNRGDKHYDRKDDGRKGDGKHRDGDRHDGDGIPVFSGLLTTPYVLTLTVTATMTISVVSDVIIIG